MIKKIFTGNTAMKTCTQYNKEIDSIYSKERNSCTSTYLEGEKPTPSNYNFMGTENDLDIYFKNITIIKNALRKFNMIEKGPITNQTIDELLVLLPLLNRRKQILEWLREKQQFSRRTVNGVTEHTYLNYSLDEVEDMYKSVCNKIVEIQEDINFVNSTKTFEVELYEI